MTKVFDKNGNYLVNRLSYSPQKVFNEDGFTISRKKQYIFSNNSSIFEFVERIYDKTGKLLNIKKQTEQF